MSNQGNYARAFDRSSPSTSLTAGQSAGFYVTVKGAPDLRYRNSLLPEGSIFKSDGKVNVGVGRSWGIYPLHM